MKKLAIFIYSVLLFGLGVSLTAQEGGEEETIEQFYLQSIQMQIIMERATGGDRLQKELALRNIAEMMDEDGINTGDPDTHKILNYLANEGTGSVSYEGGRMVNNFPLVRREACALLGRLGGQNSVDALVKVIKIDTEPIVLSEAIYQLGRLQNDDNLKQVVDTILDAIMVQYYRQPDNNLAFSALLAFEKIADNSGGIRDIRVYQAVLSIHEDSAYNAQVKNKAGSLLEKMQSF